MQSSNLSEEFKIIASINNNLQESTNILNKAHEKYYKDVLDFLNYLFDEKCKRITQFKMIKFDIDENLFILYNAIIKKYNLNVSEFIIENFNVDDFDMTDPYNLKQIKLLISKLCNDLLSYLNFRIRLYNGKKIDKKRFILEEI